MDRQYVGIDFHRRRSVIVRLSSAGERLAIHRVDNDPFQFSAVLAEAGPAPAVVVEATYGWYWVVDLLQELGATVHLANPKALNWGDRRGKNDVIDATDLADMLRLGRLPEAHFVSVTRAPVSPTYAEPTQQVSCSRASISRPLRLALGTPIRGSRLPSMRKRQTRLTRPPRMLSERTFRGARGTDAGSQALRTNAVRCPHALTRHFVSGGDGT